MISLPKFLERVPVVTDAKIGKEEHRPWGHFLILADEPDSEITIMHVLRKEAERENAQRNMEMLLRLLGEKEDKGSVKILGPGDVNDLIVRESENHDLLIIGATRGSGLQQLVFGSIPEQIAKRCSKTVIMVKAYTGIQSRLRLWIGG